MHLRTAERPAPPELLRVSVVLDRGEHHFELPDYATAIAIYSAWSAHDDDPTRAVATRLRAGAYAVGLCWRNAAWDLEVPIPEEGSAAELRGAGASVLKELQLAGYSHPEVQALVDGVMAGVFGLFTRAQEVAALADFTEAPEVETPSSGSISGSPSPPTPDGSTDSPPVIA